MSQMTRWANGRIATRLTVGLSFAVVFLTGCSHGDRIVVGSKNFTEQVILGELIAQHLETQTGLEVDRKLNLGGTFICHEGLIAGQLDIYVEYTGTAHTAILGRVPSSDSEAVLEGVREAYEEQFAIRWMAPLGFSNTYAVVVRQDDARRYALRTISDLVAYTPGWTIGFVHEFAERADGYRGLVSAYGLEFERTPREMDIGLVYPSLAGGEIDVAAGNSTDGLIDALNLSILQDDLEYFPPYEAVPLVREETLDRHPEVGRALALLDGVISEADMRMLNYRVDGEHEDVNAVVDEFLRSKGLGN